MSGAHDAQASLTPSPAEAYLLEQHVVAARHRARDALPGGRPLPERSPEDAAGLLRPTGGAHGQATLLSRFAGVHGLLHGRDALRRVRLVRGGERRAQPAPRVGRREPRTAGRADEARPGAVPRQRGRAAPAGGALARRPVGAIRPASPAAVGAGRHPARAGLGGRERSRPGGEPAGVASGSGVARARVRSSRAAPAAAPGRARPRGRQRRCAAAGSSTARAPGSRTSPARKATRGCTSATCSVRAGRR